MFNSIFPETVLPFNFAISIIIISYDCVFGQYQHLNISYNSQFFSDIKKTLWWTNSDILIWLAKIKLIFLVHSAGWSRRDKIVIKSTHTKEEENCWSLANSNSILSRLVQDEDDIGGYHFNFLSDVRDSRLVRFEVLRLYLISDQFWRWDF